MPSTETVPSYWRRFVVAVSPRVWPNWGVVLLLYPLLAVGYRCWVMDGSGKSPVGISWPNG